MWTYVLIILAVIWVTAGVYSVYNWYRAIGGGPIVFWDPLAILLMVVAMPVIVLWGKIYGLFVRPRDYESIERIKPASPEPRRRTPWWPS